MTNEEIISAAVQRVLEQLDEDPRRALATVIIRDLLRNGLEEMAIAHWALIA